MKFYMAAGLLAPTQAAAKERDRNFVEHEVPTDKEGLMGYVNGLLNQIAELRHGQSIGQAFPATQVDTAADARGSELATEGSTPSPLPPPTPAALPDVDEAKRRMVLMLQNMRVDEIENKILEAKGAPFGRYLTAAISRLGELGQEGWAQVQAFRDFGRGGPAEGPAVGDKKTRVRLYEAEERGLRYLALALIAELEKKQLPPAIRPMVVHQDADSNAGAEAA